MLLNAFSSEGVFLEDPYWDAMTFGTASHGGGILGIRVAGLGSGHVGSRLLRLWPCRAFGFRGTAFGRSRRLDKGPKRC